MTHPSSIAFCNLLRPRHHLSLELHGPDFPSPDLGPGFTGEIQEVGRVVTQKSRVRWMDTQLSPGKPV
jgi:hypothetical protein